MQDYTSLSEAVKFFEAECLCSTSLLFEKAKEKGSLEEYQTRVISLYDTLKDEISKNKVSQRVEQNMLTWYKELEIIPQDFFFVQKT